MLRFEDGSRATALVTRDAFAAFLRSSAWTESATWSRHAQQRPGGDEILRRIRFAWATRQEPVLPVAWYEADAFCRWVGGRLPTWSQWLQLRQELAITAPAEWCVDVYHPTRVGTDLNPTGRHRVGDPRGDLEAAAAFTTSESIGFRVVFPADVRPHLPTLGA